MSKFKFSFRSRRKLRGVNPDLAKVVKTALSYSEVDFGISEGLRTKKKQAEYVKKGLSRTMKSKHIVGKAVDVFTIHNGRMVWEQVPFIKICQAFHKAGREHGVSIRWGGAWHVNDITKLPYRSIAKIHGEYLKLRKNPFVDLPHFELT